MHRADARAVLTRLRPERRRRIVAVAAGLLLGAVAAVVVADPDTSLPLMVMALTAVFLVAKPHWTVLVIFVVSTFRLSPVRIGPLSTAELLAAALVFPLALEMFRDRRIWLWHVPHVRLLFGIAGVLAAATVWSLVLHPAPPLEALERPWDEVFWFVQSLLFLVYFVYFIKTPRHVVYVVVVVLLMILVAAADAVDLVEDGPAGRRAGTDYFGGFTGNENRLAHFCLWGTSLFWSLRYKGPDGWWRSLAVAPLLGLPLVTLMTGSRSGLLQLMLLGGLILLEQRQWAPAQRARACALALVVALVILLAAPAAMVQRASDFNVGRTTTIGRLHAIEAAVVMMAENPVFGVGPGNFSWRYHVLTGSLMSPHNAYIWAIVSGGPLLLILYLVLFHRTYGTLRALERGGPAAFVWLVTALRFNLILFLVFSAFATVWTAEVFWLLVGLTIVLARLASAGQRPTLRAA
ncbi:MAG TPA: O-antigen ligase family protein [Methylomirabilota bacterium]